MSGKILIVENEVDTSDRLATVMRDLGYDPIQRSSGGEVVVAVSELAPELIVLDETLTDIDGFAVCDQLKRNRESNLIPVIMFTAGHDAPLGIRGVRVAPDASVARPLAPTHLIEAVNTVLARRREHERRGTLGAMRFDVRSDAPSLLQSSNVLADLLALTPLTERQVKDFKQAFMEMGGNAIEWGNKRNAKLVFHFTYQVDAHAVTLVIRDQGSGFDHREVVRLLTRDAYEDYSTYRDRYRELIFGDGFGVMLATGLADELRYNDQGNEVTLVKRFAQP